MSATPDSSRRIGQRVADYWADSRRALTSLVFVAPLLLVYEVGVVLLGPHAVRNGVDVWLRWLLERLDFGQYFLLPVLTVCILLACHYTSREPWRFCGATLWGMAIESVLLAVCLRLLLQLQNGLVHPMAGSVPASIPGLLNVATAPGGFAGIVGFLGAGVYEELLFRLILLPPAIGALLRLGAPPIVSAAAAVVLTSLIFAAAHYVGPYGDAIDWFGFFFRFLAGAFFSVLFVVRGFGIAAGSHAAYDILVGLF